MQHITRGTLEQVARIFSLLCIFTLAYSVHVTRGPVCGTWWRWKQARRRQPCPD